MTPEQDKDGVWFVTLADGERKTFNSNSEAWSWIDRQERRETWVRRRRRFRSPYFLTEPKDD